MNNRSSRVIQMVITYHLNVWYRCIIYRDPRNWKENLLANSNSHNLRLGCMIKAHAILTRSKQKNGSSREISMVITFHSKVRFRRIIYRDTRNWTWKLLANSNSHNFWLWCMSKVHDISRRSKMNNKSSREIQMVITFKSDFRFRRIIYTDARNWTRKLSANSNGHNFWIRCMI